MFDWFHEKLAINTLFYVFLVKILHLETKRNNTHRKLALKVIIIKENF